MGEGSVVSGAVAPRSSISKIGTATERLRFEFLTVVVVGAARLLRVVAAALLLHREHHEPEAHHHQPVDGPDERLPLRPRCLVPEDERRRHRPDEREKGIRPHARRRRHRLGQRVGELHRELQPDRQRRQEADDDEQNRHVANRDEVLRRRVDEAHQQGEHGQDDHEAAVVGDERLAVAAVLVQQRAAHDAADAAGDEPDQQNRPGLLLRDAVWRDHLREHGADGGHGAGADAEDGDEDEEVGVAALRPQLREDVRGHRGFDGVVVVCRRGAAVRVVERRTAFLQQCCVPGRRDARRVLGVRRHEQQPRQRNTAAERRLRAVVGSEGGLVAVGVVDDGGGHGGSEGHAEEHGQGAERGGEGALRRREPRRRQQRRQRQEEDLPDARKRLPQGHQPERLQRRHGDELQHRPEAVAPEPDEQAKPQPHACEHLAGGEGADDVDQGEDGGEHVHFQLRAVQVLGQLVDDVGVADVLELVAEAIGDVNRQDEEPALRDADADAVGINGPDGLGAIATLGRLVRGPVQRVVEWRGPLTVALTGRHPQ
mmetsp:Transcript_16441/g.51006  ORF Transcript_16441/g.51006 Transcript_16441/m.51006 type:complete len:542 (-) Transcript_16441:12-1637(-)